MHAGMAAANTTIRPRHDKTRLQAIVRISTAASILSENFCIIDRLSRACNGQDRASY